MLVIFACYTRDKLRNCLMMSKTSIASLLSALNVVQSEEKRMPVRGDDLAVVLITGIQTESTK